LSVLGKLRITARMGSNTWDSIRPPQMWRYS